MRNSTIRTNNIFLVAGARPNFMKIAPLYRELRRHRLRPLLINTGQHYDFKLAGAVWRDLGLPKPDVFLGVGSGSHAQQTANIMTRFEATCLSRRPTLVVVVGDVNSTMACAITAKKLNIRVAHVEAGLRSGDLSMPEEVNRIVTDSISDYLFASEPSGMKNLIKEGHDPKSIFMVGNIMIDSLKGAMPAARKCLSCRRYGLKHGTYGLVTIHRPSNVDDPGMLRRILPILHSIGDKIPLLFPMHPRTSKNIHAAGLHSTSRGLRISPPAGYLDFVSLLSSAKFVLTDSGGIQEETTYLGIPCLTLRENTERPVTITEGTNELASLDTVEGKVDDILRGRGKHGRVPRRWDGKTASRIARILKTTLSHYQVGLGD